MHTTLRLGLLANFLPACIALPACIVLPSCIVDPFQGTGSDSATADPSTAEVTGSSESGAVPTTSGAGSITEAGTDTTGEQPTTGGSVDILELLLAIEGLEVEELDSRVPDYRYFVMRFTQPADHAVPDGLQFEQRLTLLHRDTSAPLVLSTSGYRIDPDNPGLGEVATLLAANQLLVEHRFFIPSRPDPADWATLTIEQSSADLHRITEAFKPNVYPARWISTGGSKGGMTSVYFRRFYPDDVDGTVAYVAPQSYGNSDPRYIDFVAQLGSSECRQALVSVQRELLLRRPAMIARMQAQAADGYTYDLLGADRALETAAIELPFTFWQYAGAGYCEEIPDPAVDDDTLWTFILDYNSPAYWSDYQTEVYEPYYFQAAVQLGYPAYDESNLADLLMYPGNDVASSYVLPGKNPVLDVEAMPDIADWLATEGRAMLFIYGEHDPYTAAAFELGAAEDSYRFIAPAQNHGARIVDLDPGPRAQALAALEAWTGVEPQIPRSKQPTPHLDLRRPPR